jgi:hypothetical protein
MKTITEMQEDASKMHQEVLNMIEALSDPSHSEEASMVQSFLYHFEWVPNLIAGLFWLLHQVFTQTWCHDTDYEIYIKLHLNLHAPFRAQDIPWP